MEENNSFDLEKMNSRYLALSNRLKSEKAIIEGLGKREKKLQGDIKILDADIELAERANDAAQVKSLQAIRKALLEQIKTVKEEAEMHKEDLTELKEKIDKILDRVRENPEVKKHIDNVLAKRYDRQNIVISKEIQEKEKKKEKESKKLKAIERISELVKNHPTLNNNLRGILQNKADIKKLLAEKTQLEAKANKTPAENQRIADIDNEIKTKTKKADKNKNLMMSYINKNKIEIAEQDIDELINHTVIGRDGQVNLDKTLATAIKKTKNTVKGLEDEIAKQYKKFNINSQAIVNLGQIPSKIQQRNSETRENSDNQHREDSEEHNESEPKWWQFRKRFKAWNERRKQKALGEGNQEDKVASKIDTKHGEFADSMKYEVVQKVVTQQRREAEKAARRDYNESQRDEGR